MLLGIVSDTHMPQRTKKLPETLVRGLQGVDRILHAGDWVSPDVIGLFEAIAPVDGVAGNNDGDDIINRLGRKKNCPACRIPNRACTWRLSLKDNGSGGEARFCQGAGGCYCVWPLAYSFA